jgi:hypothetical protein
LIITPHCHVKLEEAKEVEGGGDNVRTGKKRTWPQAKRTEDKCFRWRE